MNIARRGDNKPNRRARLKQEKAAELDIEKREAAFARHKGDLVAMLREAHDQGRKTKPFDEEGALRHLKLLAFVYFQNEADVQKRLSETPAPDRIKLLRQLGDALSQARRKADEVVPVFHGTLFVEWCVANGNPDFTDPIIEHYGAAFDEMVEKMVAGLTALREAAFRAADSIPKKRGPPRGTTALPHDFILALEGLYRNFTCRKAGAGPGPFARFVKEVTTALGGELAQSSVIEAIVNTKKREERYGPASRWGRSLVDVLGGKFPPRPS
jgi:hypothetical protein